ncbi:MAG: hypothetical protein GXP55_08220, partial [Deltaproteobacteria bacterium]|nr:hypothetical protein [Deltaproteobacteria bacterium]
RDVALAGEPVFEVVSLREAPASIARTAIGSLSYDSLAEAGFGYEPRTPSASDAAAASAALTQKGFWGSIRRIIRIGQRVVEVVRQGFGEVQRFFNGDRFMTFRLFVMNTDSAFGGANQIMRRAWGADIGQPVWLKNVEVQVSQRASLTIGKTDDLGMLAMAINRNHRPHVCIVTKNHAALVGNAWLASKVCSFDNTGGVTTRNWVHVNFRVSAKKVNLLAQASDGYDFARQVLGYRPHKARILVSPWANLLGDLAGGGRPFTLCGGLGSGFDPVTSFDGSLGRSLFDLGSFLYAESDIIFPYNQIQSRGVMSHEYGHFLMCSMFKRSRRISFTDAWSQVVNYSVRSTGSPGAGDQTLYMIEGFADFIASEIVGGVNYFGLNAGSGTRTANMFYCDPGVATPPCLEDNIGGPSQVAGPELRGPFNQRVAFVTTLLQDAFDGQTGGGDVPNEGAAWAPDAVTSSNVDPLPRARTSFAPRDETISLPGTAVFEFLENWADFDTRIRERPLLNALAETAFDHGYSADEVCTLFGLHAPMGDCTALLSDDVLSSGDVPPSAPLALTCSVVAATDGSLSAPCSWTDISAFGTGFALLASDDLSYREESTAPYARSQSHEFSGLPFDARVVVHVATVNGDQTSPEATALLNTPPEPVDVPLGSPLRGGAELRWPRVRASEYIVRMRDARGVLTEAARTSETSVRIYGLTAGSVYEFEIVSAGRTGLLAAPSTAVPVTPAEPDIVYVSSRIGDDAAPTAGLPTTPYRTLAAAITDALASDAQIVRLEQGSYSETTAIHVNSGSLVIEGGYSFDGSAWTRGGTPSEVTLPLTPVVGTCSAGPLSTRSTRDSAAGLWVDGTTSLTLRNLRLRVDAAPAGTACVSAIRADAVNLRLEGVSLAVDTATVSGSCAVPLQFMGSGAETLQIQGSDLAVEDTGVPSGADLAAACVQHATSVSVADSELRGLRTTGRADLMPASAAALLAQDVDSVRVSRSTLVAMTGADARQLSRGRLFGLWARASGSIFVDNSVVRTPSGGDVNHALDLGSGSASSLGAVKLYYVTAAAGGDWMLARALPAGADAAALSVVGELDELHVVNSLLAFAAGASVDGGRVSVIDVSALSREPGAVDHRGEALSFPWFVARWGSFQDCRTGEFFTLRAESMLNDPGLRRCNFISVGADRASGNLGFWNPPGMSDTTPLVAGGVTTVVSTPAETRGIMLWESGRSVAATDAGAPYVGTTPSLTRLRAGRWGRPHRRGLA